MYGHLYLALYSQEALRHFQLTFMVFTYIILLYYPLTTRNENYVTLQYDQDKNTNPVIKMDSKIRVLRNTILGIL